MTTAKTSDTPIQRLKDFVKWATEQGFCTSVYDFEKQCGLSDKYISNNAKAGKGHMTTDNVGKIARCYPQLNLRWLCTGEGNMVDDSDHSKAFKVAARRFRLNTDYKKAYELAMKQIEVLNEIINKNKEI